MRYTKLYLFSFIIFVLTLITRASSISNGSGGGGGGTVTSVTVAGTTNQVTASGTCTSTTVVNCTMSLPASVVMPGSLSFTGTGPLQVPSGAGLTPTVSSQLAYDTTANILRGGFNGTGRIIGSITGAPANNDCLKWVTASNTITTQGAGCGTTLTIVSGTTAMPTAAVAQNACSAAATTAVATGALTTDAPEVSFASDPTGVTGYGGGTNGGITINSWPTANQMNFKLCNQTTASVTPGAISVNWRIIR